ncbi:MAG: ComEC/Rec2 family competence protein [Acutalibacteraceae bacterium]
MAGKESARRTRRAISAVSGLMAVLALLALYFLETRGAAEPAPTLASGKALQEKAAVYFLDVGQGDSILIRAGDYAMLIDAGVRGAGDAIEADLEALGVDALDAVVATHPHADHIGAMDQILEDYEVGTFYMPVLPDDQTPTTATYERMLDVLLEKQVPVERVTADMEIPAPADMKFEVLSPRTSDAWNEVNDYSAVLRFTCGEVSFLLTGDAEVPAEALLVEENAPFSAAVLKCGHHGSASASSMPFLRAVNPEIAVISCGADNGYGHPHDETLKNLAALGCTVLRTDTDGTVAVVTDGERYTAHTWSAEEGLSPAA